MDCFVSLAMTKKLVAGLCLTAVLAFPLSGPLSAQEEPPTPDSVVASASSEDWVSIAPEDILIMELTPAADGSGRSVVIQLLPPPFSQPWVENIKTLARAHWWDGKSVYRVVDNWVAQWGGDDPELGMDPRPLPDGVVSPEVPYTVIVRRFLDSAYIPGISEQDWRKDGYFPDSYNQDGQTDFWAGWPISRSKFDAATGPAQQWPIHCYGHVGVARDMAPDTGTGSELYAVIGHAPRQLDRNIAVVGRVIEGIEHLSTLPRGTGDAGVYEERSEDTPIVSVRLASEHPDGAKFAYEYLDTNSETFARYVAVRANRNDAFYTVPAGGVDICNVQVPIRLIEE